MSIEICYSSAIDLATKIRNREVSPVEVVQAHLDRIDALNPKLNAIVTIAEDVLDRAREAEAEVGRGSSLGPLHGVPYTLKDCVETAGLRTTLGSRLFEHNISDIDATVHTRLRQAGGILLGKTNMPEFAFSWETDNLVFGRTNNPWDLGRTPGGSSGGEAAALSSGLSPLGVGTDLGGSVRHPASFCGIIGLKPTLGRVPYTGIQPQVLRRAMYGGPMARTVKDVALGLSIMAGADGIDFYAPPVPVDDYMDLDSPLPRLKVGWSSTTGMPVMSEVRETVTEAANFLTDLGLEVEEVDIPSLSEPNAARISTPIYLAEASLHLRPIIMGRESELTELLRSRYVDPNPPSLKDYLAAANEWEMLKQNILEYFTRYDLFLCPTVPIHAYPHGDTEFAVEDRTLTVRQACSIRCQNLSGAPAISVPFGLSTEGTPIGVQLVGRHFDERTLLKVARALEASGGGYRRPPIG